MDVPAPGPRARAPRLNPLKKPWFWILVTAFVATALLVALGLRQRFFSAPPVVGSLPAFHFVNQRGEPFGSEQLKGQVWIANFIFTRCPSICPKFTGELKKIQQRTVRDGGKLQLVSFSVDPEFDTPEVLQAYAQKYEANPTRWTFLTGEPEQVKGTIVQGFKVALGRDEKLGDNPEGIFHGTHFVLVDGDLNIRGYYKSDDPSAVGRMVRDARLLIRERS